MVGDGSHLFFTMEKTMNNKILLAMSGGIDSSASAILLKKQGYTVIGATMQLFDDNSEAIQDAKMVCKKLDIPHHVLDCRKEFNDYVINYFKETYSWRANSKSMRAMQYIP